MMEKFLIDLKKEFSREDDKTMKVAKLKKVKQESRTMEQFIQEFKKIAKGSGYEKRLLVE